MKLEGPLPWNDSYVIYKLTTSNERGGVAKTEFEINSYNQLLKSFNYISKDDEALVDEKLRVWKDTGVLYIQKRSGYQWGMSPIMTQDNTVLTMEKFLEAHIEKKD